MTRAGSFAADKDRWLKNVASDTTLGATDLAVAIMLSIYLNFKTRYAFPGLRRLATDTNRPLRSVCRSVRKLEAAGHIEVERSRGGRRKSNRYWLSLNTSNVVTGVNVNGKTLSPESTQTLSPESTEPLSITSDTLLRRAHLRATNKKGKTASIFASTLPKPTIRTTVYGNGPDES